jgi:hypothetical protein
MSRLEAVERAFEIGSFLRFGCKNEPLIIIPFHEQLHSGREQRKVRLFPNLRLYVN